ncbi:MAG TPA: class I SAM-dependent methyltransferase [Pseudobdellovibrionaceae bacterium]|nr:class I SAM-dependent methyltransferase [Pseudobdellovibrionaceae bacterium]
MLNFGMHAEGSKLTEVVARDGLRVAKLDGMATASTMQPGQEAERWVSLLPQSIWSTDDALYVVGIGSGWHLEKLHEKDSGRRVVGLDVSHELIQFARQHVSRDIELQHVPCPAALNLAGQEADFRSWVSASGLDALLRPTGRTYRVLSHRPSLQRDPRLKWVEEALLGRTPRAFAEHLRVRPELAAQLRPHALAELATCPLLSVKSLQRAWTDRAESAPERRLFRMLEELVRA